MLWDCAQAPLAHGLADTVESRLQYRPSMATRALTDRQGDCWKVWKTVPEDARGCQPGFAHGWLTFEHEPTSERRRLAPVPDDWETVSEERLLLMSRVAEAVKAPARRTPPQGIGPLLDAAREVDAGG